MNIERRLVRKDSLKKLFDVLISNGKQIYAPVTKNEKTSFHLVREFNLVSGDYIQTTQSSKDVSFPRTEKLLDYVKSKEGINVKPFDLQNVPESVVPYLTGIQKTKYTMQG
jgi:hypothetical protein